MKNRRNGGAALVMALFATVSLVSLALFAAAVTHGRVLRSSSRLVRCTLADEARKAVAETLWKIDADTNSVDSLEEKWAHDSATALEALAGGGDGVFVVISDERARLGVPECGADVFAALLALANPGLDAATAAGIAEKCLGGIRHLQCEEALLLSIPPDADEARDAVSAALPFLSAHSGGSFNINTAPQPVVIAAALGSGAVRGGAEGLWLRLEMARKRRSEFKSTDETEALKLLRGEGDRPTAEELAALEAIKPRMRVDSGLFRIAATARRRNVRSEVECVYERGSGRILRWTER